MTAEKPNGENWRSHTESELGQLLAFSRMLSRPQRLTILASLLVRVVLVGLDVVGLGLVGVSVALLSSTGVEKDSITGKLLALMLSLGIPNTYVLFAFGSVLFFVVKAFLAVLLNRAVLTSVARIEADKANDLFKLINRSTLSALKPFSQKEIRFALLESIEMAFGKMIMSVSVLFGELVLIVFICTFLFITDGLMFIWVGSYFMLVGWVMHWSVSRKTKITAEAMQKSSLDATGTIFTVLENHRQIFIRSESAFFEEAFRVSRTKLSEGNAVMSNLSVLPRYITEISLILGFALLVAQRTLSPGASAGPVVLAIFVAGSFRIVASLLPLQGSLGLLRQVVANGSLSLRVFTHLQSERALPREFTRQTNENTKPPKIDFENVTFSYDSKKNINVIEDLTFSIFAGESIAIRGRSGAGKSTIADLLLGLLDPISGSIRIDGLPPRDYLALNPDQVGYMPQTSSLFDGTIAQNVSFMNDNSHIDFEKVNMAVERVGLAPLVESLPHGSETLIGELRMLSGGQIQRIGLARILYQAPKVIVLDESTSALDEDSEKLILETIKNLKNSATIVVISHNQNTLKVCDRTIILNENV